MRLLPGAGVAAAAARAESAQQRNIEMDFAAFEYDRTFVIEALRCGEIDYLENVSEAEEADLFRHLLGDRKSTRLNSSHITISYAVFCLKKKITNRNTPKSHA